MRFTSKKDNTMGIYESLLLLMVFAILIVNVMNAVTFSTYIKKQEKMNKQYMNAVSHKTLEESLLNIGNDLDGTVKPK